MYFYTLILYTLRINEFQRCDAIHENQKELPFNTFLFV